MPFGYFGAKHGLSRAYPPPLFPVIVEPFAGSAAYACRWAPQIDRAILYDVNPGVVALWHRLQRMTASDVMAIECPPKGEYTDEPLIACTSGGQQAIAAIEGKARKVTAWTFRDWPRMRARIAAVVPHIRRWVVVHGDYRRIPNFEATWFVDPPYQPALLSEASGGVWYTHDSSGIGYPELGRWCTERTGQVIVCEQMPAAWLPFKPLRRQMNGVGKGTRNVRTEAVWIR